MNLFHLERSAVAIAATLALIGTCGAGHAATADRAARNLVVQGTAAPAAQQQQRLALVIGNAAYREAPLPNPVNDARAIAEVLRSAGFTVMLHTDVDLRGLHGAVREFGNRLREGGVGLFYFAGHGMQIKGRNYLIPVGADIQREDEVAYAALDAQAILDKMESAANGTNLMLLDACRNNPFARSFRSSAQGLAQMEAPVGTLVAFSTAPGTVASDGSGQHGLYTQHLLEAMRKPGSKVEDVFKQVRAAVRRASRGQQIPWESTSLEGDLYFFEPAPVVVAPPAPPPQPVVDAAAIDDALWQTLEHSRDAAVVRAYLDRFPQGRHADAARRRIEALKPAPVAAVLQPSATATPAASPEATPKPPLPTRPSQADQDARLTTLLREQAERVPPRVAEQLAAAPPTPSAAAPGEPAALHASGSLLAPADAWTYRIEDRWTRQPPSERLLRVKAVSNAGLPTFDDDAQRTAPHERLLRALLAPAAYGLQPPRPGTLWWEAMKPGESRQLEVDGAVRLQDGSASAVVSQVSLRHAGTERIRVPAGEFDAVRLDASGVIDSAGLAHVLIRFPGQQRWSLSVWYVPQLRGFAAMEVEVRTALPARLEEKTRAELLRFDPAAMAVAAPPNSAAAQRLHAQAEGTQRRVAQESAASQSALLATPAAPVPSKEADRLTALLREQAEVVPPRVALGSSEGARTDRPASSPTADNASLPFPGAVVVGDRWTYSRSDRWRGVPDDEWVLAVKSVGETGIATFVDEAQPSSSRQLLARQLLQRAAFGFEALSAPGVWWSWMKHGDSQEVTLHAGHRRNDGSVVPVSSQVTLRHRGVETVRVPAGSVLAIRLEAGGVDTFRAPSGAPVNQHWTMTLWYAPELRGFASMEADIREPGGSKLASRSRLQLLRFEPGATAVAAR